MRVRVRRIGPKGCKNHVIQDQLVAGKSEDKGVTKDNKGDRVTKERREVKCRKQEREAE